MRFFKKGLVGLSVLLLVGCDGVSRQSTGDCSAEPDDHYQVEKLNYRQAAVAQNAFAYLRSIINKIEEYRAMSGDVPRFLSDMNIVYPDVNAPREIYQIRLVEDGYRALALLPPDGRNWVSWRMVVLDNFPYMTWECEKNFHAPDDMLPYCDLVAGRRFSEMAPSFDCGSAQSKAEKAICNHDRLMDADRRLDSAYRVLLEMAEEREHSHYRRAQVAWLQTRDNECVQAVDYTRCLDKVIRTRTSSLYRELAEIEASR